MAKSKFFRVAVEGGTTDGRTITREWIEQMAKRYNQSTYGARVNMEHIRGYDPNGQFKMYGDITAAKTEDINGRFFGAGDYSNALDLKRDARVLGAFAHPQITVHVYYAVVHFAVKATRVLVDTLRPITGACG